MLQRPFSLEKRTFCLIYGLMSHRTVRTKKCCHVKIKGIVSLLIVGAHKNQSLLLLHKNKQKTTKDMHESAHHCKTKVMSESFLISPKKRPTRKDHSASPVESPSTVLDDTLPWHLADLEGMLGYCSLHDEESKEGKMPKVRSAMHKPQRRRKSLGSLSMAEESVPGTRETSLTTSPRRTNRKNVRGRPRSSVQAVDTKADGNADSPWHLADLEGITGECSLNDDAPTGRPSFQKRLSKSRRRRSIGIL
jgi:hypothetical protein